jgi:hypothetical protein
MNKERKRRTTESILPVDMRPTWPAHVVVPVHGDDREDQRATYLALVEQFGAVVASIDKARGCLGPVDESGLDVRWSERLQLSRVQAFEETRPVNRLSVVVTRVDFHKGGKEATVALGVGLPDLLVELKQSSREEVARGLNHISWRVWQEIDRERRHYLETLKDRKLRTTLDGKGRRKANRPNREGATAGAEPEVQQPQRFWGPTERVTAQEIQGGQTPESAGVPENLRVARDGGKPKAAPREPNDPFDVPVRKQSSGTAATALEGLQKRGAARKMTGTGSRRAERPKDPRSEAGKGFDAVVDVQKLRARKKARAARSRSR